MPLAGLTEPDEGTIHFDGEVVFDEQKRTPGWGKVNQEIGMIFQTYTLWPHMNVLDNLTLAPRKKLGMSASEARTGPKWHWTRSEEGIAVALVTHDMAFAAKAADRLVFFHEGEIAVNASPERAFNQTEDEDLKKFVDAVRF